MLKLNLSYMAIKNRKRNLNISTLLKLLNVSKYVENQNEMERND